MSKQLIFVSGAPYSGRTTWINKHFNDCVIVDANTYPNLYVKLEKTNTLKLFEDTIEDSRLWCLEQIKSKIESENEPIPQKIVLSLIACRPDRWREFIELAILNEYELVFKFPTNKLLFYPTKHNSTMEQSKFIETKVINKYPKDKKEIYKKGAKGDNELVIVELNESTLLRQVIIESESAYAFYLSNKEIFTDKEELLKKINENYKIVIMGDIKRAEKKVKDAEKEIEKKNKEVEKETKRLAKKEKLQITTEEHLNIEEHLNTEEYLNTETVMQN